MVAFLRSLVLDLYWFAQEVYDFLSERRRGRREKGERSSPKMKESTGLIP